MASCWRRARISAISSRRGAKKEPARKKRSGKRAINEKRDREIQIRKSVSSIRVKIWQVQASKSRMGLSVGTARISGISSRRGAKKERAREREEGREP